MHCATIADIKLVIGGNSTFHQFISIVRSV